MSLEQEVELVRRFPIFSRIQPAMQKLLCFSSERLTYEAGQVIFRAGDMADAAYVVIDGSIEISVPTPKGPLVVSTVGRNEIIGEIAIFGEYHSRTEQADEREELSAPPRGAMLGAGQRVARNGLVVALQTQLRMFAQHPRPVRAEQFECALVHQHLAMGCLRT
jgi:CRP-like cAMP-binding protein